MLNQLVQNKTFDTEGDIPSLKRVYMKSKAMAGPSFFIISLNPMHIPCAQKKRNKPGVRKL